MSTPEIDRRNLKGVSIPPDALDWLAGGERVSRKYVLTKLGRGDYLLPHNDGQRVFRLSVYEDGPSHGLDDWPADRTLWSVCLWLGGHVIDPESDERWSRVVDGFATRHEAIAWVIESA